MSKVFVDVGISLDGFLSGPNPNTENPIGEGGLVIHEWMFNQMAFRRHLHLGEGGEKGTDNDLLEETFERIGANIMGKVMFNTGEFNWPENAPFHCPVYVLTHEKRAPWERLGGTTFYFVNEPIDQLLEKALQAAGQKDVRISGGSNVIQQYLNAGLVEELHLHIAPVFLGKGIRLLENIDRSINTLTIMDVIHSEKVTHLRYKVTVNRD
jgi:dihydrofolate reductase